MKYYRNAYRFEVLSNEPIDSVTLEQLSYEVTEGHWSGVFLDNEVYDQECTREEITKLLLAQGSDPEFLIGEEDD